jgi:epoxyqueuosine reductase QueG
MLSNLTIKQRALDLGFDLAGIAPIAVWRDLEFSRQWVEKGFHGDMRYLENPKRFDPRLILPSAKSVICVGLIYNTPLPYSTQVGGVRSQESGVRSQKTEEGVSGARWRVSGGECAVEGEAKDHSENVPPNIAPAPSPQPLAPFLFNGQRPPGSVQGRRGAAPRRTHRGGNGPGTTGNERLATPSDQFPFSSFHFPVSAAAAPRGWISRYAWGQDYHEIMQAKLEQLRAAVEEFGPDVETRAFVDTGPVVERAFARFSGIGWMGKNTCLINQEKGSWFFLGVILTNLELAPDLPAPDRCGSCMACLEACPTGALIEPYVMDASRCISYFTIEMKGPIPERFRPKIGANVFGCDICQDVCPWNSSRQLSVVSGQLSVVSGPSSVVSRPSSVVSGQSSAISYQQAPSKRQQPPGRRHDTHPATTKVPQFHPMTVPISPTLEDGCVPKQLTTDHGQRTTDHGQLTTDHGLRTTDHERLTTDHGRRTTDAASFSLFNPPLDALAQFTEKDFRRIFARSPIKRAKYRGWLRNLCVAMGNSGDERFVPWLERAAQDSDPIVREHATWALGRLRSK